MQADLVIVRLGEITLKGKNRHLFVNRIERQIRRLLSPFPRLVVKEERNRIYVELNGEPYEEVASRLDKVFGLVSYSPAYRAPLDLEQIRIKALEVMRSLSPQPKTFKVSVRRANKKFPHGSNEMGHLVGSYVLPRMAGLRVDVRQPEVELRLDIRDDAAYLFTTVVPGMGGFPLGSNGKAMLMLSGGIDSPVAGWLAMRRGLEVEAVHFHSYPYTSERAKQKVIDLSKRLAFYAESITLHLVPFTEIQTRLLKEAKENLLITFMRRAMFRITEQLAWKRKALAIVTGESLGQVASQTLQSIYTIGKVTTLPVLRPLITMDKVEITRIAEKIDTYPISILPYEDCCTLFVPKSPSTSPNAVTVERMEAGMTWLEQAILEAVEQTETMTLTAEEAEDPFADYF